VPAIEVVAEPLRRNGVEPAEALRCASMMLERLNVPQRLWNLAPATFSGGEQQRINIARGFVLAFPVLLLDEPTSALDAQNREAVMALIRERLAIGTAMIGIFHDADVRATVATRICEITGRKAAA